MYIQEATIYGFTPFDTFGIKSININATSIIQILIGDNGSGKSTLLKELSPLPAVKSMYHKNGGKELLIIHDNNIFKVSSTFNNDKAKHSFIMNDSELNTDGTATLQTELAERYLGYIQTVHNFITCKYDFVNLRPSERKNLLTLLSLAVPPFIIDMHKYAKSKLREYKNNLSLLYTRKLDIESKLDKDKTDKLKQDKIILEKDYTEINNKIYHIEQLLNTLDKDIDNKTDPEIVYKYFDHIKEIKKEVVLFMIKNNDIKFDIDDHDQIVALTNLLNKTQFELNTILEDGKKNASEIEELNKNLELVKSSDNLNSTIKTLDDKNKYLEELKIKLGDFVNCKSLNNNELELARSIKDKIFELLNPYLEMKDIGEFISQEDLTKYNDLVTNTNLQRQLTKNKIETITKTNLDIKSKLSKIPEDPKEITNSCNSCNYREIYKHEKDELLRSLTKNEETLDTLTKNFTDLDNNLTKQKEELIILTRNFNILNLVYNLINNTPYIYNRSNKSFLEIGNEIKTNVNKFLIDIDKVFNLQPDIRTFNLLNKEVEDINTKIKYLKESNLPNIQILEKLINDKKIKRKSLIEIYNKKKKEVKTIEGKLEVLQEHGNKEKQIKDMLDHIELVRSEYVKYEYNKFLKEIVLKDLREKKADIDNQLFVINKELKEQESLQERYDKEIIVMIKDLEERKEYYTYLELSLSPETGLTHHNLIKFVNSLIKNVNFVISKIWTSKLEMIELKSDDDFSCNFLVNCNGNIVKIENLSKGQTKVMNFAWYIALQIALDTKDYPVFFDECDENLDKKHKEKYIEWLKTYIDEGYASQMWLVNHDAALYTGFINKDIICLSKNNITNVSDANSNVEIKYN